jgi:RimJ/RimL family protein N-acetyltransferase
MSLVDVYTHPEAVDVLYKLLKEREPHQNISHNGMPTRKDHVAFVESKPYKAWYLIQIATDEPINPDLTVGAIYLTKAREVGIGILKAHRGHGHARNAIQALRQMHPGKLLANINPHNKASRRLFEKLGFNFLQVTYHAA